MKEITVVCVKTNYNFFFFRNVLLSVNKKKCIIIFNVLFVNQITNKINSYTIVYNLKIISFNAHYNNS